MFNDIKVLLSCDTLLSNTCEQEDESSQKTNEQKMKGTFRERVFDSLLFVRFWVGERVCLEGNGRKTKNEHSDGIINECSFTTTTDNIDYVN
ncbi:hypothetical protein ABH62_04940 [Bacillus cereus]|uniref:Uncharacterized protein n=1 Tax=Bacillus cereus TaxID=1396 RepID=A0A9X5ZDK7_BACCE|nr:hypothetical Protein FORC21_3527 [Bacillus cereus]OBZ63978.1 hypothetical protein ABH62_04940 [Bacillus cereus]OJS95033.1 hypothetical protein BKK64_14850 [Bacillus cereus]